MEWKHVDGDVDPVLQQHSWEFLRELQCSSTSDFGCSTSVQVCLALKQLIDLKQEQGFIDGPAISDEHGIVHSTRVINNHIHEILEHLFDLKRELFPPHIRVRLPFLNLALHLQLSHTLDEKVGSNDINVINR